MLMQSNLVEYWTSELEHLFLTRLAKFYHLFPVHSWGPSRPESCFHYHHNSSKGKIFLVIYPSLPLTLCPCLPSYVHLPPSPSLLIRTLSKSHILSFSSFPSTLSLLLSPCPSFPCSHYEHIVFAGVDLSHCSTMSYWDWRHRKNPRCLGGWVSLQWRTLNPSCMHKGQGKPSLSLNSSLSLPTSPLIPSLNFLPSLSLPPSLITSFFPHAFSFSLSLLTNISYLAKFLLKYPFPFIYPFLFTDLSSFPSLNSHFLGLMRIHTSGPTVCGGTGGSQRSWKSAEEVRMSCGLA